MTATFTKPSIVLVHGIWHSPLTYVKLSTALQRIGYDVHAPFLPSCTGARPPTASLPEDTQLVRRLVEILADQGRPIIMVMHSYGGVVGCNALEGLDIKSRASNGKTGGVAQLIGLAAHIHPKHFAILDIVREMGNEDLIPAAFDISDDGSCMSGDPRPLLFDGVPEEGADSLLLTLSRSNFNSLESKVQFEAWKHIPLTYVHTRQDITLPTHYQWRILAKMEKAGISAKVVELDTGHSPFVTRTEEVVKIVEDVARTVA